MWNEDRRYPGEATFVDPEGQVHRLRPIKKKWKYASRNNKPADNRLSLQTKAASSPDKIMIDFHTDATYNNRIPNRVSIVDDSNREDFLAQEKQKRQRIEDERFNKEVEDMRVAKRLRMLQDSYRRRGIVI